MSADDRPVGADDGHRLGSTVRLRIGRLDSDQSREARLVLRDLAARRATRIVVDLTELDDRHELAMLRFLTDAKRGLTDPASELIVVGPSSRLARLLRAVHVDVSGDRLVPTEVPCDLRLDFGDLTSVACLGRSPVNTADNGGENGAAAAGLCSFGDDCVLTALRRTIERGGSDPSS